MSLFEIYLKLNGFPIKKVKKDLEKIQKFSEEDFIKWQNGKKWEIAKYHYKNNKLYRKLVGGHFPDDWDQLPILEKSHYQGNLEELISKPYKNKSLFKANTSGSSGHPFFFVKDKYCHARTWALIDHRYNLYDIQLNSKEARFYGIPLNKKDYFKEIIKDLIMRRVRFPVFDLKPKTLALFLKKFEKKEFDYICGYTNSLVHFAKYLLERDIILKNFCPSLKICIATAEMLFDQDKELLGNAFGITIVNEYGASEVGIIAFEFPDDKMLTSVENLYLENISLDQNESTGSSSEILITSLFNKAMPFIRYKIGDRGTLSTSSSKITHYQSLENLEGRTDDFIILPNGKVSAGLSLYYVSKRLLEESGIIKEFITKQVELDKFVFEIVSDRDLTKKEVDEFKKQISQYLDVGLKIEINRVDEIQRPVSGKIKHFYSYIN